MANNQFNRNFNKFKKEPKNFTRVNFYIKSPTVRVVHEDGTQLGVLQIEAARKLAFDSGLDLVEIVPNANPPVCRLTNFDKFRYEQKQKEKESRKKQKQVELREVRLRPNIQEHDVETKINTIIRLLNDGAKVMVNLEYKKREISHKEAGFKVMNLIVEKLKAHALVEAGPKMEGSRLICRFTPKIAGEANGTIA